VLLCLSDGLSVSLFASLRPSGKPGAGSGAARAACKETLTLGTLTQKARRDGRNPGGRKLLVTRGCRRERLFHAHPQRPRRRVGSVAREYFYCAPRNRSGHWLPRTYILHGFPGFFRLKRRTALQQFNGNIIRRSHKRHTTVTRRAIDRCSLLGELRTDVIYIVDSEGQMTEIASSAIDFLVPIKGQLDHRRAIGARRRRIFGRRQVNQRVATLLVVEATNLLQAQAAAKKGERRLDIGHSDHCVQIAHRSPLI